MQDCVFCRTTDKDEQTFYLVKDNTKYMLFVQPFRRSNKEIFAGGVNLKELNKYKNHHSYSVRKIISKLPMYFKYLEQEYDLTIFKVGNNNYKNRKECFYLYNDYLEEIC